MPKIDKKEDRAVVLCLFSIFFMNVVDAVVTTRFLANGWAEEANPFMRVLTDRSLVLFVAVKLLMVASVCIVYWAQRKTRGAKFAILFVLLVYIGLMFHFLYNLI